MFNHVKAKLVTGPAVEPIVLADAKLYLKVDVTDDDSLITSLIIAARIQCEEYTKRAFITQTWDLWMDDFPLNRKGNGPWWDGVRDGAISYLFSKNGSVDIPRPPLQSVTFLKTYDETETSTTFDPANYLVDVKNEPGRVALRTGSTWPVFVKSANAIQIQFIAGYGDAATNVPSDIITAIKMTMALMYENRGDQNVDIPKAAMNILNRYVTARL